MEKQENNIKITVLLFAILLAVLPMQAFDYGKLHIATEINGERVNDVPILKDNDHCSFFIADQQGDKVEIPEGIETKWSISFKGHDGFVQSETIGESDTNQVDFDITPPFFDFTFVNEASGITECLQDKGMVICEINGHTYKKNIMMDVLPEAPVIEIIDQRVTTDAYSNTYPMVTLKITTSPFKYGFIEIDDLDVPPYLVTIDGTDELPLITEVAGGVFLCGFRFQAYNDYGMAVSNKVYSDILPTSIKDVNTDTPNIHLNGKTLEMNSLTPINDILITDMSGLVLYHNKNNVNIVRKDLTKGLYILTYTDNKGKKTTEKILIK